MPNPLMKTEHAADKAWKCEKCGSALGWCEPRICDSCAADKAQWTGDDDGVLLPLHRFVGKYAKEIADAHNAEIQQLREQLAAAQEYSTKCHARMSERKSVHQWLTAQNIPEEENGKRICLLRRLRIALDRLAEQETEAEGLKDANRGLFIESNQRFQKLAELQAQVKDHNESEHAHSGAIEINDTTALDAAIADATYRAVARTAERLAAAQQPLVELLEWIRGDAVHGRPDIVRKIDAELAKVKEGKA